MTVIVTEPCYLCDGAHRVEVLSWNEWGEAVDVRMVDPCPGRPTEPEETHA